MQPLTKLGLPETAKEADGTPPKKGLCQRPNPTPWTSMRGIPPPPKKPYPRARPRDYPTSSAATEAPSSSLARTASGRARCPQGPLPPPRPFKNTPRPSFGDLQQRSKTSILDSCRREIKGGGNSTIRCRKTPCSLA